MGLSFGFRSGFHVFTTARVLKMSIDGDDTTFLSNTASLRVFQIDHNAPAHTNKVMIFVLPLSRSNISAEQLVGEKGQLRLSRIKAQRNTSTKIEYGPLFQIYHKLGTSLDHTIVFFFVELRIFSNHGWPSRERFLLSEEWGISRLTPSAILSPHQKSLHYKEIW